MTDINRWTEPLDDGDAAFLEAAGIAVEQDLAPHGRETEIAEAPRITFVEIGADSILAGTLRVAVLLALDGILRTAASGARVELDKNGLRAYDGSGQVVDLNAAGTFQLGPTSGARVVLTKNSLEIFNAGGESVFKAQNTDPFVRIGKDDGTAIKLSSAGALISLVKGQLTVGAANQGASSISNAANLTNTLNTWLDLFSVSMTPDNSTYVTKTAAKVTIRATTASPYTITTYKLRLIRSRTSFTDVVLKQIDGLSTSQLAPDGTINDHPAELEGPTVDFPDTGGAWTYKAQIYITQFGSGTPRYTAGDLAVQQALR